MEPKIAEVLVRRIEGALAEMKTLYELNDTEVYLLSRLILETACSFEPINPMLIAKLMKAAAFYIESVEDIAKDLFERIEKDRL